MQLAIGVAIGLALAASGWTAAKIGKWIEAKVENLIADTLHKRTLTAAVANSSASAVASAVNDAIALVKNSA